MNKYYVMQQNLDRNYIINRINSVKSFINLSAICRELGLSKQSVNSTLKSNGTIKNCSVEDLKLICDFLDRI